ncbi:D-glycerate dehydrogenase, partial [Mesorhizobium sp. M7A.F.Ca.US.011.01.1.1]
MNRPKVIVTRQWPREVEQRLADQFDVTLNEADRPYEQQELREALLQADAVLPTVTDRFGAGLFAGGVRARMLGNFGVGFNHIDIAAARAAGLVGTNT